MGMNMPTVNKRLVLLVVEGKPPNTRPPGRPPIKLTRETSRFKTNLKIYRKRKKKNFISSYLK